MSGQAKATVNKTLQPILSEVRKELLDFGLKNPLLNYRLLKSRGLEPVGIPASDVYRTLVTEEKEASFLSAQDVTRSRLFLLTDGKPDAAGPFPAHDPVLPSGTLPTTLDEKELEKRLLATYYAARSSIEEQGVNTLYIALGMLLWREPKDPDEVRSAPLLLVPVELERGSASEGFHIKYSGDDVTPNVCLIEYLKQSFGIDIEHISESEELDIDAYCETVRKAVSRQVGWDVQASKIALGFFSFAKFLMYRDLDSAAWKDVGALLNHEILNKLLGPDSFDGDPSTVTETDFIDDGLRGREVFHVIDADSTQSLAILDVSGGRSMAIQGPPGTGKSQTIVNLIAEAVSTGKKILFVSEKKAALDVVKQRLDRIGLGPACLALHSNKAKKRDVVEDLRKTANLENAGMERDVASWASLQGTKDRLNAYCAAVNAPVRNSGVTAFDLYGRFLSLRDRLEGLEIPALELASSLDWTEGEIRRKRELVSVLQDRLQKCGVPKAHPFWGSQLRIVLPSARESIRKALNEAAQAAAELRATGTAIASLLGIEPPESPNANSALLLNARHLAEAPDLTGIDLRDLAWKQHEEEIRLGICAGQRLRELRAEWADRIKPSAWSSDITNLREDLGELGPKLWRFLSPRWRQAKRRVSELMVDPSPKPVDQLLAALKAIQAASECKSQVEEDAPLLSRLYAKHWKAEDTDWDLISAQFAWVSSSMAAIAAKRLEAWCLDRAQRTVDQIALSAAIEKLTKALGEEKARRARVIEILKLSGEMGSTPVSFLDCAALKETQEVWRDLAGRAQELDALVAYLQAQDKCDAEGLGPLTALSTTWQHGPEHILDAFEYARISRLLDAAFEERHPLADFNGQEHDRQVDAFRRMDQQQLLMTQQAIARNHATAIPKSSTSNGQLGVLRREFEKKARHLALRKLMLKAGNAVQALKPVFMMSPLSVANFLPPCAVEFDLVIFDEASQVRPADALGAIVRSKQVVVVGDSKQLPPTSFFDSMLAQDDDSEDDDAVATSDIESILGLFRSRGAHERMLRWHYRSRHESLIAVSNHLFYDDRLVVFPSPDREKRNAGLIYRKVENAPYDRSGTRTNRAEARIVANAVMKHAAEQMLKPKEQRLTLGVAAFSVAQRDAILDELEILRRRSASCEEFFATPPHEQFFVKNLENVQGDERDVIFISVGYGRTSEGYLAMSFGPVNRSGGERRLNVLFTRARRRCEIFTTLGSDDIDVSRSPSKGVLALKTFLQYAERGRIEVPMPTGRLPESPFEEQVLNALRNLGYIVDTQVGSAGFFLDLAIVDPSAPGRYLLGIECDGAAYHSARSTRDRDRLRQAVLEGLGWKIHRIWSTAWFRDSVGETEKLILAIKAAEDNAQRSDRQNEGMPAPQISGSAGTPVPHPDPVDITEPPARTVLPKYQMAEIKFNLGPNELHLVSKETLINWLAKVVAVEGPVHWLEAARRIANAAGVQRVGSRIQEAFERAYRAGTRSGTFACKDEFLSIPGKPNHVVRDRSGLPNQFKKLELVSPEEIGAAIEQAINDSYGLAPEDVAAAACRLLGFQRVTEEMRATVEKHRDLLIGAGRLIVRGESLVCCRANET